MYKLNLKQFKEINKALNPHESGELVNAVNARDIHAYLGVGRDFSNWIKQRINKYGFVENIDYIRLAKTGEVINQQLTDVGNPIEYHLSPDMTKQIAMVENNDKGRIVRLYYIDLERRSIERQESNKLRSELRGEFPLMTKAIVDSLDGKDAKFYHFTNECDLINKIALGCTASKFRNDNDVDDKDSIRDYLTKEQKAAILGLQRANTVYIDDGLDFNARKEKLKRLFDRKYKQTLIDEILLLSA
jgi:phage anti-repressor protein